MSDVIAPGTTYRHAYAVSAANTVPHLPVACAEIATMPAVLATPSMIAMMEVACTSLLARHLKPGHGSLGVLVNVTHTAASVPGQTVTVDVEVAKVEGPRITFNVKAHDGIDTIGEGVHERFVVPLDRFTSRVNAKAARAGVAPLAT